MSDECGMMSSGHDRIAVLVETMLKLHQDVPEAETRRQWADSSRLAAADVVCQQKAASRALRYLR